MSEAPTLTEFTLHGAKTIRFVAVAIRGEIARLAVIANDQNQHARANAINDIGLYQAILTDMREPE